jgi:CubicO group peptidase (beta-lactamase class C family)
MSTSRNKDWDFPSAGPEEVGFSSERLKRIAPAMQSYIDRKKVPNIVTLIARHGKIVHLDARGYLDLGNKKPVAADSIFRLYSNSKPIAGVAALILVEEGLMGLDDPVSKYIPAFRNPRVRVADYSGSPASNTRTEAARREITIRDCLRNTTGLATPRRSPISYLREFPEITAELGWEHDDTLNIPPISTYLARVEAQAGLPLSFHPGTDWEYHVGYAVLGAVIEKIAGKTLEEFYQERIFRPLCMKDTSFYLARKNLARFTTCYHPELKKQEWVLAVLDQAEKSEKVAGPRVCFAAGGDMGGVLSTIGDYTRFAQMLLNGGELNGVRILGRKTVELMTTSHTGKIFIPFTGPGFGFGLGVGVYIGGSPHPIMRSVGSYGWGGAAGTNYLADPKESMLMVCFTQVLNHTTIPQNNFQEDFEKLVYQALI